MKILDNMESGECTRGCKYYKDGECTSNDNSAGKGMQPEALRRGWKIQHLTFSDYSVDAIALRRWHAITGGRMECGDATDGNCIVEIGTLADCQDWQHKVSQLDKMSWTGLKHALFIRDIPNSYWTSTKQAGLNPRNIDNNLKNLLAKAYKRRVPVFPTISIAGTFDMMEYYFDHVDEMPKPINTWYLYKGDVDVITKIRMIAVIPGIGVKRARSIVKFASGEMINVFKDAWEMELGAFTDNYKAAPDWGPVTCELLWRELQ
jgi:hypothetical protein